MEQLRWGHLLGATVTVLVTTLDDSVWLIPFVVRRSHGWWHACVFVTTLVGLAVVCCFLAAGIATGLGWMTTNSQLEWELQLVAILLCWSLALGFFLKKQCKRQQQRHPQQKRQPGGGESQPLVSSSSSSNQQQQQQQRHETQTNQDSESDLVVDDGNGDGDPASATSTTPPQTWTVVSLTTFGFLDEISYFPALLLGKVFTAWELCVGTFLAGLCMVGFTLLAAQIRPVVGCLDRIPLYAIIAAFATLLTVQLVRDPLDDTE